MRTNRLRRIFHQRGFVFLLAVLVLIMLGVASLFLFAGGNAALIEQRLKRETIDVARLKVVKDALIGFAIGAYGGGSRPGQLPLPDTLEGPPAVGSYNGNENPGCLDGTKLNGLPPLNASSAKSRDLRCIGRIPWRKLGLQPETPDENDPLGSMVWYAVSANLADPNFCLERLNSGTMALSHDATAPFACPNAAPPFPWLKVCNESGRVLKDRVAFVLMLPGRPIATQGRTQQRAPNIKPQPGDFLDAIPLPSGWSSIPPADRCSRYDNAGLTNEFVVATQSDSFNDNLVYVTIDELAAEIERRVAFEVRKSIQSFVSERNVFPWLAPLANPTVPTSYIAVPGATGRAGLVPFHTTHPDHEFLTELGWALSSAVTVLPSVAPGSFGCDINGIPQFCRLRSQLNAVVSNSVTTPDVQMNLSSQVTTPSALCKWTVGKDSHVRCNYFTESARPPVTPPYRLETRLVASGPWTTCGEISGTVMRKLNVVFDFVALPTPPTANPLFAPATATEVSQREVRNNSIVADDVVEVVDSFSTPNPTTCGVTSFRGASIPVGRGKSTGPGNVAVGKIRVYPAMPEWYFSEEWNQYIYAALSADVAPGSGRISCDKLGSNCLSAGDALGIDAVIIAIGKPLLSQNRILPAPENFVEGKNKDGATTKAFASSIEPRSETYVDFVAPLVR